MEPWQAVLLGLVEGITEYLPVSSTGHLILVSALVGLTDPVEKRAHDAYLILLQGGAVLAVVGLYRARIGQMLRGLLGRSPEGRRLLLHLALAFAPAAAAGPILDERIEAWLFRPWPVLAALFLGGIWMIGLSRGRAAGYGPHAIGLDEMDARGALGIGLFQCLAFWPGTSRSMVTIAGGVLLGLRPREAAEFSFLLGVPTLGGACAFKLVTHLSGAFASGRPTLFEELGAGAVGLGFLVATLSAALSVRWLVSFLNRHGLAAFGWYRIGLSLVLAALLLTGAVSVG